MPSPDASCQCRMCKMEAAGLGIEAYLADIVARIDAAGWAVQGVPADDESPSWAYSVGLWHSFRAPELAVFGLPLATMAGVINVLGGHVAGGARLEAGDRIDGICECSLQIRTIDQSWRLTSMFAVSDAVYGPVRPPALQVFWPDQDGRFPWERGFAAEFDGQQPWLWLPRDDNPPSQWTRIDTNVST